MTRESSLNPKVEQPLSDEELTVILELFRKSKSKQIKSLIELFVNNHNQPLTLDFICAQLKSIGAMRENIDDDIGSALKTRDKINRILKDANLAYNLRITDETTGKRIAIKNKPETVHTGPAHGMSQKEIKFHRN